MYILLILNYFLFNIYQIFITQSLLLTMHYYEKMRLEISIHMTKRDLKKRWREINPESRSVLRKEFGEWMNKSSFEEDELLFFDYLF